MARPRQYSEEFRDRAVRLVRQWREEHRREKGAIAAVAEQLGMHPETLRNWVNQHYVDDGLRPGTTTDDRQRIAELERENRELRRANEILKSASAFFARDSGHRIIPVGGHDTPG